MGGLTASIRLAHLGYAVTVFEARSSAGGLASSFEVGGLRFDAGPYVLLDRPGLDWAFQRLGLDLGSEIPLVRIEEIYDVRFESGRQVQIYGDRHRSAEAMEKSWPGSAKRYLGFVGELEIVHRSVQPLQYVATPGWRSLVRTGAVRHAPFLMRGLRSALRRSGLASEIVDALSIWTHIARQSLDEAPSLLALVPALIHTVGAFYPRGGIGVIPSRLAEEAETLGVTFRFDTKVGKLRFDTRPAVVVDGELLEFDAIVSNAGGVGTYLELCDPTPPGAERLRELALQSPGRCTYLSMASPEAPYLRFYLGPEGCEVLAQPSLVDKTQIRAGRHPARLISAEAVAIDESWWTDMAKCRKTLAVRMPSDWGKEFHLYQNSMNPVMTARLARRGRLRHRSPNVKGLYLVGSSTHPGQWVSFCAISGILGAEAVHEDFAG